MEITVFWNVTPCRYETVKIKYCFHIAIRLPTDATVYFVHLFPLFLPYMFRALISPSSGVSQAVFYIQPFGSCSVYVAHLRVLVDWFVVVVFQSTSTRSPRSPQAHADEQHKHCMNQIVVYKKQLELPLMMGLWEPETCRVEKEINTQNKQLHPLVTLLQYVQKMHCMNNLKKMELYFIGHTNLVT